jgi:hypothetical protein
VGEEQQTRGGFVFLAWLPGLLLDVRPGTKELVAFGRRGRSQLLSLFHALAYFLRKFRRSLGLSATLSEKPASSNQSTVLFSQNKLVPAISYQPSEQTVCLFNVLNSCSIL